jgi:hypothetical protein
MGQPKRRGANLLRESTGVIGSMGSLLAATHYCLAFAPPGAPSKNSTPAQEIPSILHPRREKLADGRLVLAEFLRRARHPGQGAPVRRVVPSLNRVATIPGCLTTVARLGIPRLEIRALSTCPDFLGKKFYHRFFQKKWTIRATPVRTPTQKYTTLRVITVKNSR